MANLSVNPDDYDKIERIPEPGADDPYEDEVEPVRVYGVYEGPNHSYTREEVEEVRKTITEYRRKPSIFSNAIGSGFSPEEIAAAREEYDKQRKME